MTSCHDVTLPVEAWRVTVKNILFIPAVVSVNFLSELCHLLMCQVNSMLLYHFLQLLWSTRKQKDTMGYKSVLLYLFIQTTDIFTSYVLWHDWKKRKTYEKCFMSQLHQFAFSQHKHHGKKGDHFPPLNSIVLFSASTSAPAERVIFISSQRCHTLKCIFNNQMCITVTFNSKLKYVLCSRVNNLQCI